MKLPLRVLAALVVIAVVTSALWLALRDGATGDDAPREPDGTPDADVAEAPATAVLYMTGTSLRRVDLTSGGVERIGSMPTEDVHAAPTRPWLAYVVASEPQIEQEDDFISDPVVRVIDVDTGEDREVGPGFSPRWHPTDPTFVYLAPIDERQCSGESCAGFVKIMTYDVATERRSVLTEPGRYNLLAWSGHKVLFADESDLSITFSVGAEGGVERLEIAPGELWDASPDGRYLLRSSPGEATLIELSSDEEIDIDIGRGVLAEGSWSPDSQHIAGGVLDDSRTRARASVIEVPGGKVTPFSARVPGVLDVRWAPDGREFGFLTFVGATNRVEINRCRVTGPSPACDIVGPELRRATFLRFEN